MENRKERIFALLDEMPDEMVETVEKLAEILADYDRKERGKHGEERTE